MSYNSHRQVLKRIAAANKRTNTEYVTPQARVSENKSTINGVFGDKYVYEDINGSLRCYHLDRISRFPCTGNQIYYFDGTEIFLPSSARKSLREAWLDYLKNHSTIY